MRYLVPLLLGVDVVVVILRVLISYGGSDGSTIGAEPVAVWHAMERWVQAERVEATCVHESPTRASQQHKEPGCRLWIQALNGYRTGEVCRFEARSLTVTRVTQQDAVVVLARATHLLKARAHATPL